MNDKRNLPASTSSASSPFATLRQQMDRIFDDFGLGFRAPMYMDGSRFLPSTEASETDKTLTLSMELPGLDTTDVKITAEDRTITISGEKKQSSETKEGGIFQSERSYGSFMRSFTTPFEVDTEKVEANFSKGVLTITIQKPESYTGKKREIEIKH